MIAYRALITPYSETTVIMDDKARIRLCTGMSPYENDKARIRLWMDMSPYENVKARIRLRADMSPCSSPFKDMTHR